MKNLLEPEYPEMICRECGVKHGKKPMSEGRTSWNGKCDICGQLAPMYAPEDYGQLKDTWLSVAKAAGTACALVLLSMFICSCSTDINRHTSAPLTAPVASDIDQISTTISAASNDLSAIDSKIISIQKLRP